MHLAVNAWPMAVEGATPLRYHVLERFSTITGRRPEAEVTLIAPKEIPAPVPPSVGVEIVPCAIVPWQRLLFDQRFAPGTSEEIGADLLLNLEAHAPLRSPVALAVEMGRSEAAADAGMLERARRAVGRAGASGAALRYKWQDQPGSNGGVRDIPPFVGDEFRATDPGDDRRLREGVGLPAEYVLCHGAEEVDLPLMLASWTWVAGSVGDEISLVLLGLTPEAEQMGRARAVELGLGDSVEWLPTVEPASLPAVYRGAAALLHPGHTRTGQELRWALASGTPVAGVEMPTSSAILGEAGYLVGRGHARALGAATLTLLVQRREVAQDLREKGLLRARDYHSQARMDAYWDVLSKAAGPAE